MRIASVVVADLGLVMPKHRQPAVAAQAVPTDLQHLADAPAGGDGERAPSSETEIDRLTTTCTRSKSLSLPVAVVLAAVVDANELWHRLRGFRTQVTMHSERGELPDGVDRRLFG